MRSQIATRALSGIALAVALSLSAGRVYSQSTAPAPLPGATLPAGTRVRVTASSLGASRVEGTIAGTQGDTMLFRASNCRAICPAVPLLPDRVTRLEVYAGRNHGRGALVGALVGGLGGVLVGSAGGGGSCDRQTIDAAVGCAEGKAGDAIAAWGIGALAGALVGAAVGLGSPWKAVPLYAPRVAVTRAPSGAPGVALQLSVRW